ncbi:hypothetical protein D9M68_713640 [compost metagenome]
MFIRARLYGRWGEVYKIPGPANYAIDSGCQAVQVSKGDYKGGSAFSCAAGLASDIDNVGESRTGGEGRILHRFLHSSSGSIPEKRNIHRGCVLHLYRHIFCLCDSKGFWSAFHFGVNVIPRGGRVLRVRCVCLGICHEQETRTHYHRPVALDNYPQTNRPAWLPGMPPVVDGAGEFQEPPDK